MRRRRGGVICVLRCLFANPVIPIEFGHHGPQPSPERHDESTDANIVSRQIPGRRLGALRYGAVHHGVFLRTYVDPLCSNEEALRDRFWETCLNRLKARLFPLGVFYTTSFNL